MKSNVLNNNERYIAIGLFRPQTIDTRSGTHAIKISIKPFNQQSADRTSGTQFNHRQKLQYHALRKRNHHNAVISPIRKKLAAPN